MYRLQDQGDSPKMRKYWNCKPWISKHEIFCKNRYQVGVQSDWNWLEIKGNQHSRHTKVDSNTALQKDYQQDFSKNNRKNVIRSDRKISKYVCRMYVGVSSKELKRKMV